MLNRLTMKTVEYFHGDPKRIQHFIKVCFFAGLIGEEEGLDEKTLFTLKAAAIVHDIGIKNAEAKYGSCSGRLQELEGPPEAEKILRELGFEEAVISRVCYLVSRHHTYTNVDGPDCQILIEADFLVNLYEDGVDKKAVASAYERIFKTPTGKSLCEKIFYTREKNYGN